MASLRLVYLIYSLCLTLLVQLLSVTGIVIAVNGVVFVAGFVELIVIGIVADNLSSYGFFNIYTSELFHWLPLLFRRFFVISCFVLFLPLCYILFDPVIGLTSLFPTSGQLWFIHSFHSFIQDISVAPLQGHHYSAALPITDVLEVTRRSAPSNCK